MGVYIPNMEMPTSCEKCPFLDYEEGFCFASGVKGKSGWYEFTWCPSGIKDGRHKDCPLVPVPPHGRLIDADALRAKQQEDADLFQGSMAYGDKCRRDEAMNAVANIVNAPTIIPAKERFICPVCGYDDTPRPKPATNYDLLISKTPEELAEWLATLADCPGHHYSCQSGGCKKCWLDWLLLGEEGE